MLCDALTGQKDLDVRTSVMLSAIMHNTWASMLWALCASESFDAAKFDEDTMQWEVDRDLRDVSRPWRLTTTHFSWTGALWAAPRVIHSGDRSKPFYSPICIYLRGSSAIVWVMNLWKLQVSVHEFFISVWRFSMFLEPISSERILAYQIVFWWMRKCFCHPGSCSVWLTICQ